MAATIDFFNFWQGARKATSLLLAGSTLLSAAGRVQAQVATTKVQNSLGNPPTTAAGPDGQSTRSSPGNAAQPPANGARGALGVLIAKDQGAAAILKKVEPGSVADQAGLRAGDRVLAINGVRIQSSNDFARALRKQDRTRVLRILIDRDGHSRQHLAPAGAIASSVASADLNDLAQIGVSMSEDRATHGVLVTAASPGGPADEAGLRAGDLIVAVDGKRVNSPQELQSEIRRHRPGDELDLNVIRDGWSRDFLLIAVDQTILAERATAAQSTAAAAQATTTTAAFSGPAVVADSPASPEDADPQDSEQVIDDPNLRALYTDFD